MTKYLKARGRMIAFTVVPSTSEPLAQNVAARHVGVMWCRFDDEILFWETPYRERLLPDDLRLLGGPPQTAQGDLYLVVQVGNAFLTEFPSARVAINRGRYLAVDLTASEVKEIQDHNSACFGFCPLPENAIVVQRRARTQRQPDPNIAALVAMVSQTRLADTLARLTGFHTRHSLTAEFSASADQCKDALEEFGYAVSKQVISVGTGTSFNVVADKPGMGPNRRLVIVAAHLDSVNSAGGVTTAAPGADDNGSGTAGVLEMARVLTRRPAEPPPTEIPECA